VWVSAISHSYGAVNRCEVFSRMASNRSIAVIKNMSKLSITSPSFPLPQPLCKWSEIDALQVGCSLSFPTDLYTQLNNALVYRTRKYGKTFTRRASGDVLIVWRLS
jgi:hypothetical protein